MQRGPLLVHDVRRRERRSAVTLAGARCPGCGARLDLAVPAPTCAACGAQYPRIAGIPVLLPRADQHIALWRGQLGLLLERGRETLHGLEQAARDEGLAAGGAQRLRALAAAVNAQVVDIAALLRPALGGPGRASQHLPRGVVEHLAYLLRDWAWPTVGHDENDKALAAAAELLDARRLGRTLVVGAGGCRLAYDLHRLHGATQTVAVDIDPYLLVIAEHVVRGASVRLTEASLKVMEAGNVSRTWTLQAPAGPLAPDAFHCLFADGLEPPFADESFDTVVTPWFIDQVPRDLPAFIGHVRRLLKPGGRWLNQGPLIYPEGTAFERRFSRDELFDLARRAGLEVGPWSVASRPYLVSPLSGSGRAESILTFVANRA